MLQASPQKKIHQITEIDRIRGRKEDYGMKLMQAGLRIGMTIVVLGALSAVRVSAQEPTPAAPVSQTTATPVATPAMTKDELKAQRKQQKQEEKAANANAKAAKSQAKAKKDQNKALREQEKTVAPQE